jgi:hypothetical protein
VSQAAAQLAQHVGRGLDSVPAVTLGRQHQVAPDELTVGHIDIADMLGQLGRGLTHALRPTLGDLVALHAAVRGTRVATPEEADYCFMARPVPGQPVKGLTAFEAERIAAELLV